MAEKRKPDAARTVPVPEGSTLAEAVALLSVAARAKVEAPSLPVARLVSEAIEAEKNVLAFEERHAPFRLERLTEMDAARLTPEDRANVAALTEICEALPFARDCKRVADGVEILRAISRNRPNKKVPREIRGALERIGRTIATPKKAKLRRFREPTARERSILAVYSARESLGAAAREEAARKLGYGKKGLMPWERLRRSALRLLAMPLILGGDEQ